MRLIKALQDDIAPHIFADARAVFDGRKNMFTPAELNLGPDSQAQREVGQHFSSTIVSD
jgi:hypothetical protein